MSWVPFIYTLDRLLCGWQVSLPKMLTGGGVVIKISVLNQLLQGLPGC